MSSRLSCFRKAKGISGEAHQWQCSFSAYRDPGPVWKRTSAPVASVPSRASHHITTACTRPALVIGSSTCQTRRYTVHRNLACCYVIALLHTSLHKGRGKSVGLNYTIPPFLRAHENERASLEGMAPWLLQDGWLRCSMWRLSSEARAGKIGSFRFYSQGLAQAVHKR